MVGPIWNCSAGISPGLVRAESLAKDFLRWKWHKDGSRNDSRQRARCSMRRAACVRDARADHRQAMADRRRNPIAATDLWISRLARLGSTRRVRTVRRAGQREASCRTAGRTIGDRCFGRGWGRLRLSRLRHRCWRVKHRNRDDYGQHRKNAAYACSHEHPPVTDSYPLWLPLAGRNPSFAQWALSMARLQILRQKMQV
jgi:hypothetical protein